MNPGDPILLEAPLYAGVLPYLQVIDAEMVGTFLLLLRCMDAHDQRSVSTT